MVGKDSGAAPGGGGGSYRTPVLVFLPAAQADLTFAGKRRGPSMWLWRLAGGLLFVCLSQCDDAESRHLVRPCVAGPCWGRSLPTLHDCARVMVVVNGWKVDCFPSTRASSELNTRQGRPPCLRVVCCDVRAQDAPERPGLAPIRLCLVPCGKGGVGLCC